MALRPSLFQAVSSGWYSVVQQTLVVTLAALLCGFVFSPGLTRPLCVQCQSHQGRAFGEARLRLASCSPAVLYKYRWLAGSLKQAGIAPAHHRASLQAS